MLNKIDNKHLYNLVVLKYITVLKNYTLIKKD